MLRAANLDDIEAMAATAQASIWDANQHPAVVKMWAERLNAPRLFELMGQSKFWVVDDGVGFASLEGDELGLLYVHPEHQRQGIARRLVTRIHQEHGGDVFVDAASNAHAAYLALGFVDLGPQHKVANGVPYLEFRMVRYATTHLVP